MACPEGTEVGAPETRQCDTGCNRGIAGCWGAQTSGTEPAAGSGKTPGGRTWKPPGHLCCQHARGVQGTQAVSPGGGWQSCLTLYDPIDGSPPGSPVPGFSRQEHWSGLPFPSPMHESESKGLPSKRCPGVRFLSRVDREFGIFQWEMALLP